MNSNYDLIQKLPRGAVLIKDLSIGNLMIGAPPESIKDLISIFSENYIDNIPQVIVLRDRLFDSINKCMCEELEQYVFFNYFALKRKTYFVCDENQKERVKIIIKVSTFGKPLSRNEIKKYYPDNIDENIIPDFNTEFNLFSKDINLDNMVDFFVFDKSGKALVEINNENDNKNNTITIKYEGDNYFTLHDEVKDIYFSNIFTPVIAPAVPFASITHPNYLQLRNSISFVSAGSGFDPIDEGFIPEHKYGSTVCFVIWDDMGIGTVVDPLVGFPNWMRMKGIHFYKVQNLILTHTHFDHDAGTIERILADPVNVYTTPTIMDAFLEKSSAITGISEKQIISSINFCPVKLHTPIKISGFTYTFSHSIHSIETIRFTFQDHEKNKYYYSSDIVFDREQLKKWVDDGFITKERMEDVMSLPSDAKVYIQEQGGPSVHTPAESIAELPEKIRNKMWIVHTTDIPVGKDGNPIPGLRLAKPDMMIPLEVPLEPQYNEFASTYDILSKLDRIPLFHNLPMTSLNDIKNILQVIIPKRYKPGEQIIKYDDVPDKMFILIDGSVSIEIPEDENCESRKITRDDFGFVIGDAIGSNSLEKRDADVFAGKDGLTTLEIDEADLNELNLKGIQLADMIKKNRIMRKHGVYMSLEKIPLLKDLPYSQKQEFSLLCHDYDLKTEDDRWLIKQGEINEYLYILAEGQVEIIAHEKDGKRRAKKRIATSESNLFGEISILTESRTIASVYIVSDLDQSSVYRMHRNDFFKFLRDNPNFNLNFRKNMENRITETSNVRKNLIDVLKSISNEYLNDKK